ncbi:serine protease [Sulfurimicrobium lacus]|uniref:Probable periplasmic serine endoprotease DegP-like n=1 Tax=Sulfurimicrobium lacus TaxID=2715678 RepID=A0A6F8VD47_9PROT|nr:DegQ family serine endoprotease [Sulfurimicrobium lacus]BCB26882.1 serine protease [Sulfurimicrobium lacus]
MNRNAFFRSTVFAAVVAAAVGAYVHFESPGAGQAQAAMFAQSVPVAAPVSSVAAPSGVVDFSGIVERYGPAVVNISVSSQARVNDVTNGMPNLDPNDPFYDFFRRFGPHFPNLPRNGQITRGEGSGFIVNSDGVILTNAHVVDGAQEVTVKLTDRREFKAKVIGKDKQSDIAVLKIAASNLPVVKIGDPASAKVGEPVLAIGSPYGFENSASAGIISAKSRTLPQDNYVPFIQTDVAVNPGNSGGPLFNVRGEVIGVNSQIYSQTGGYQGLSFAIPIDVASKVQNQLLLHGKVTRGRLGIVIQDVSQALADSFGLKQLKGALVSSVEKDSPAGRAGIEPADVIVRLGDKDINSSTDLPALVADLQPGTSIKLTLIRKGTPKTLTVTVGEMKADQTAGGDEGSVQQGRMGLAVRPLDRDEQRQAGVPGGLLVEDVAGPAARAGIQAGDVVLSLNGTPVNSVEQLRSLAAKAGKHVALLILRDSNKIFIPLNLG